jgi:hypothetical protein
MSHYSANTRVEPTWLGWLSIEQSHYEEAVAGGDGKLEQHRLARNAIREAKSMFPNPKRFAAAANTGERRPLPKAVGA